MSKKTIFVKFPNKDIKNSGANFESFSINGAFLKIPCGVEVEVPAIYKELINDKFIVNKVKKIKKNNKIEVNDKSNKIIEPSNEKKK